MPKPTGHQRRESKATLSSRTNIVQDVPPGPGDASSPPVSPVPNVDLPGLL
ncbi:hypothetical protein SAMN00790413_03415 [Deinococcus hopiensis KR-140]|uniref:Uncharacterized protein n=1 Tax=Deinococcus hopiensis KR-140 TaxID=695939 RepID=A0A1W1UWD9_9DEIO|nr:hypothetical protein SAMN00790413_03415 [Deinococcus hopiensis KR-140]